VRMLGLQLPARPSRIECSFQHIDVKFFEHRSDFDGWSEKEE
jgi:hypothetical protein